MESKYRVIIKMPVDELQDESGISLHRSRELTADDIKQLLRDGPVRFAIANVGRPLRWIPQEETFRFWKEEASAHLVDPARIGKVVSYAYGASEWSGSKAPIILLEMFH